jgi:hypothetical protein
MNPETDNHALEFLIVVSPEFHIVAQVYYFTDIQQLTNEFGIAEGLVPVL